MNLSHSVQAATRHLSSYWPLQRFITMNPKWDMTDESILALVQKQGPHEFFLNLDFYQLKYRSEIQEEHLDMAIQKVFKNDDSAEIKKFRRCLFEASDTEDKKTSILMADQLPEYQHNAARQWIESETFEWLLYFFGSEKKDTNLYQFWQQHAAKNYPELKYLTNIKNEEAALEQLMKTMKIPDSLHTTYFTQQLMALFGWGSLINWKAQHPYVPSTIPTANIPQLLVVWTSLEWVIKERTGAEYPSGLKAPATFDKTECLKHLTWQTAYELAYQEPLIDSLKSAMPKPMNKNQKVQFIFCIDVRSELIRKHIEALGNYETFGYAGFFGFAFALKNDKQLLMQCPGIIEPSIILKTAKQQQKLFKSIKEGLGESFKSTQSSILGAFALFESVGLWALGKLFYKTCCSNLPITKTSTFKFEFKNDDLFESINYETALNGAAQFLKSIGLTKNFANNIVICGHQSHNVNNPFSAALDCGACGGNGGLPNAALMCEVLNQTKIRKGLNKQGIIIPEQVTFSAGLHETVTDNLQFFDSKMSDSLKNDLQKASSNCQRERAELFPVKRSPSKRSRDWSEQMVEMGLANNASIIIAPRSLTREINLNSQAFLHSYEADSDQTGEILEGILNGPVIVAHMINAQYYFSTVFPEKFGAGSKAIHNVIPNIGVMSGNLSDLKVGLPEQSVRYRSELLHKPRRLLVVVVAPQSRLTTLINQNQKLKELRDGGWVRFEAIEPNQPTINKNT